MIQKLFFIIITSTLFWSCANQTQPTGGPKDEDPPILISSSPESGALNVQTQTIQLEFNEMVKQNNIQSGLIITPSIQGKFKTRIVRNRVTLTFDEPFADSTTYTLNFRESITDVTENNPAEDLIIVFSTGPVMDSLQISGTITSLLYNTPAINYTVALYLADDTLDLFNSTPMYAIQTIQNGTYNFRNIKSDSYRIFTWLDKNKDLQCQSENEPFAFTQEIIQLDSNMADINLYPQFINLRPLSITASRQQGQYYEVRFSKPTISYDITSSSISDSLYHHYIDDKRAVRIYNTIEESQNNEFILTATDSAGYNIQDTIQLIFEDSPRPPDEFFSQVISSNLKSTTNKLEAIIQFNKPIKSFMDSSWYLVFDSTSVKLSDYAPTWEWNDNRLTISSIVPDSLTTKDLQITFSKNSFQSIESDTSQFLNGKVRQLNPDKFGIIELKFPQDSLSFKVQLLDSKGSLKKEYPGGSDLTLEYLDAGQYRIRILLDQNNDGAWDPGNYFDNRLPEPVIFFFDEEANTGIITLKQNWVMGPFTISLDVENWVNN